MERTEKEETGAIRTGDAARRTLAMRIAHRNRLRAERMARLRADPALPAAAEGDDEENTVTAASSLAQPVPEDRRAAMDAAPSVMEKTDAETEGAALEEFFKALSQSGLTPSPLGADESFAPEPASVLPFQRPPDMPASAGSETGAFALPEPRAAPICDLHRLEGVGPGLTWALQRAGIACLAEMASLEPGDLSARLGYLGRLVPAGAWIAAARAR